MLISSIVVSLCLLLLNAFQWIIIDKITPFIYIPLITFCWFVFLILWIYGFYKGIKRYKLAGLKSFLPSGIMTLFLLLIIFIPFTTIWINFNFSKFKKERELVVNQIYTQTLLPNVEYNKDLIHLDNSYSLLSMGGNDIFLMKDENNTYVLFYTYRGISDNYSGFVHTKNTLGINDFFKNRACSSSQVIKMDRNWYYISCH